jgi:hypothetical protein
MLGHTGAQGLEGEGDMGMPTSCHHRHESEGRGAGAGTDVRGAEGSARK